MSTFYFQKELLSNAVVVSGKRVQFEPLDGNRGVIQLDSDKDKPLVEGLMHLANQHRAGVVLINQAQYDEKKKAHPFNPSANKPRELLRVAPTGPQENRGNAAADKGLPHAMAPAIPAEELAAAQPPVRPTSKPTTARVGRRTGKLAVAMQSQLGT